MWQASGISGVSAQRDRLPGDDLIAELDERAARREVPVMSEGAVRMANLDPVGLEFSKLPVAKLHPYVRHDARTCGGHRRPDGHDEVIRIFVGISVSAICAVGLIYVVTRTSRIRKNITRGLPIRERAANILAAVPSAPSDECRKTEYPRERWAQVHRPLAFELPERGSGRSAVAVPVQRRVRRRLGQPRSRCCGMASDAEFVALSVAEVRAIVVGMVLRPQTRSAL